MTEIDKQVTISNKEGLFFKARLSCSMNDGAGIAMLSLLSEEIGFTDIEGYDFFDSLIKVRQLLEEK